MQILLSHGGRLGRFSLSQLLLAVITGIGLFSVAKVATDTMLMYAMPKREAYKLFVRDVTPDFSPSTDEERAVLAEVLRAKRGERLLLQGRQLNTVSDGLGAPMLGPLSATTPTVQNAASGDV